MRFVDMLRLGSFTRVFLGMVLFGGGLMLIVQAELWMLAVLVFGALVAAMLTSLSVAARWLPTVRGWQQAAERAADEDFNAPITPGIPHGLQDLRGALVLARRRLADSLERARKEKALLLSMVNAMTEGVVAIDTEARIILVNRVALNVFGVSAMEEPETFEGRDLVQLARDPRLNELVDRVLATGRPMRDETEIIGTRRHVELSVAPVKENERLKGVVAVLSDETALRKLERVRQDFVTNVSHELKTPIAAIRGWSETLVSGVLEVPEPLLEPLETIHRQSERLTDLVNDLMTLARVEAQGLQLSREEIDIEDVINNVRSALDEWFTSRSIRFEYSVADDARRFPASGRAMEYILRNLVDNAVKYSDEGGLVVVRTYRENDEQLAIEVSDTGRGIERHHLARVFERFYRVDAGRSREMGGTGLGLSIVKHFATALGGRVSVDSEPGRGSTFTVTVPIQPEPPADDQGAELATANALVAPGEKVHRLTE